MDLAADVAGIVLKEMEREEERSPFILGIEIEGECALKIKTFFVKNVLHFRIFSTSTFLFNLKSEASVSALITEKVSKNLNDTQSKNCFFNISKEGADYPHLFTFSFDAASETILKFRVNAILKTYTEICECNRKPLTV